MAQDWLVDTDRVLDIGGVGEQVAIVKVSLLAGRVDVVTHDDSPTARLEIQDVVGPPLSVRWDGTTLKVSHLPEGGEDLMDKLRNRYLKGISKLSARVSLSVPSTAVVTLTTVSADVLVNGAHNDVKVTTVSGPVTLDDIHGAVRASTVSGDVEAHQLQGRLRANTVSGALTVLSSMLDTIKLNTVSGGITLDLVSPTVEVTSTSVSGDVTVRVPAGGGYAVTSRTVSGHVVLDGVALGASSGSARGGIRTEGDEATTITATSVSGNVVVLRNRPADPPTSATRDPLAQHAGTSSSQDEQDVQDGSPWRGTA